MSSIAPNEETALSVMRKTTNARGYGDFVKKNKHECDNQFWIGLHAWHIEVPMTHRIIRNFTNFAIDFPSLLRFGKFKRLHLTHDCVQVDFQCFKCFENFSITYEAGVGGKYETFGFYRKTFTYRGKMSKYFSYLSLQENYNEMWSNYNFSTKNCKNWAYDFYIYLRKDTEFFDFKYEKLKINTAFEAKYKAEIAKLVSMCFVNTREDLETIDSIVEIISEILHSYLPTKTIHSFTKRIKILAKNSMIKKLEHFKKSRHDLKKLALFDIDGFYPISDPFYFNLYSFSCKLSAFLSALFAFGDMVKFSLKNEECYRDFLRTLTNYLFDCFSNKEIYELLSSQLKELYENFELGSKDLSKSVDAFEFMVEKLNFNPNSLKINPNLKTIPVGINKKIVWDKIDFYRDSDTFKNISNYFGLE